MASEPSVPGGSALEMSPEVQWSKRAGARFFGVLFQFLAVIVLIATVIVAAEVAHLSTQVGVSGSRDPIAWAVLAAGVFASCVLAGLGYALGILCAIYDRQELDWAGEDIRTSPATTRAGGAAARLTPQGARAVTSPTPASQTPAPDLHSSRPDVGEEELPDRERGALWEWLTRERHLMRSDDS